MTFALRGWGNFTCLERSKITNLINNKSTFLYELKLCKSAVNILFFDQEFLIKPFPVSEWHKGGQKGTPGINLTFELLNLGSIEIRSRIKIVVQIGYLMDSINFGLFPHSLLLC